MNKENRLDLWGAIEEVEPDELDLRMLEEARQDPDCRVFTPAEEIDWDASPEGDIFYTQSNLDHINRGIRALEAGEGVEHELIEAD